MKKLLYQITNLDKFEKGEPFALCDKCYSEWAKKIQGKVYYERIGDNTPLPCNQCGI